MRVGLGYDFHRLVPGRPLLLGGVHIPFCRGEEGHSDGDVLIHAVIDALLGASCLGDIGGHFPPSDNRWKDISSRELLRQTVRILAERGFAPVQIDAVVVLEKPKILPFLTDIRALLAEDIGIGIDNVSVKGKTREKMGVIGRSRAIEAHAVAVIEAI
jgi:2-C-methyl-D-erythritol 2,4-cyclodiphosphate synthase